MIKILKKICFLSFLCIFSCYPLFAQEDEEYTEPDTTARNKADKKFIYGGNFGFAFGSIASIEISPVIGYHITERISLNAGPVFEYYSNSFEKIKYTRFGFRYFARFFVLGNIYTHVENETLFIGKAYQYLYGIQSDRKYYPVNNFLFGGGLKQGVGQNGGIYLSVLWYVYPLPDYLPLIRIDYMF